MAASENGTILNFAWIKTQKMEIGRS